MPTELPRPVLAALGLAAELKTQVQEEAGPLAARAKSAFQDAPRLLNEAKGEARTRYEELASSGKTLLDSPQAQEVMKTIKERATTMRTKLDSTLQDRTPRP